MKRAKTDEELGFSIMGGSEQNCPIYVSRIVPGGIADRSQLRRGDQLLSVNGVSVDGETHEKAVSLLKAAREKVTLIVRFAPEHLNELKLQAEGLAAVTRDAEQENRSTISITKDD